MPLKHRAQVLETQSSPRLDTKKPLPPILPSPIRESGDTDLSIVLVDKVPFVQEPLPISRTTTTAQGTLTPKRRSMSVSDADSKKTTSVPSAKNSLPSTLSPLRFENSRTGGLEDTTFRNVLDQFRRDDLFQLGSSSGTSLDLQDPSTPARKSAYRKKMEENVTPNEHFREEIGNNGSKQHEELNPTKVRPRNSSLRPNRASSSSNVNSSSNIQPHGGPSGSGSLRDTNRLHPLHRSTASTSEPSLLPIIDDSRICAH